MSNAMTSDTSPRGDSGARRDALRERGPDVGGAVDDWLDNALELTFPASDPLASPPSFARNALPPTAFPPRDGSESR
jgi:hypothetical protein